MSQEYGNPSNWPPPPGSEPRFSPAYESASGYSDPSQSEAYQEAVKRVEAKLAFYKHLALFLIINLLLWVFAIRTLPASATVFYPMWVTLFWGLGLLWHWRAVFVYTSFRVSQHRRQRMIERELRRMKY